MIKMTFKRFLAVLFIPVFLLASGCATTQEQYNSSPLAVTVPAGINNRDLRRIMTQTFEDRSWTVVSQQSNAVVGQLEHRNFKTQVTMDHRGNNIVLFVHTERTTYNRDNEPVISNEVPMGWIQNLQKDLRNNLQKESQHGTQRK